jgi:predicted RecA/RadA family phage recombinase
MKTFIHEGKTVPFTAPAGGVVSGTGVLIGSLFVIPEVSAAEGEEFNGLAVGVVTHAKTSAQAWTEGAKIYWDAGNSVMTTTSSGNTLVGVAAKAASNPSATGRVRLDGVAR